MPRKSIPKSRRQYVTDNGARAMVAKFDGAVGAPFPKFIEPALATLVDAPPKAAQWVHEIKFDGYRLQIHKRAGQVTCWTRRGYDWTKRFGVFIEPIWHLPAEQLVLDGEVIVPAENGLSDFGALESDLAKGGSDRLIYYAFDLLHLDGFDLRRCALLDRKRALAKLIGGATGVLRYSEHLEGDGPSIFKRACDLKLEGVVSKRTDSRYSSGRTSEWAKITCRKRDTFVVAGIAYKGTKFDGVYLGRREEGGLVYAGKVERGFSEDQKRQIAALATRLKSRSATLKVKKPKALWLKPEILADVEYRALTGDGKLRHPSFKGIREDL
jgi:bifunctional non-homologous end joining protein LigD